MKSADPGNVEGDGRGAHRASRPASPAPAGQDNFGLSVGSAPQLLEHFSAASSRSDSVVSLSLVVGGVVIMTSCSCRLERTREIGLRKALGAGGATCLADSHESTTLSMWAECSARCRLRPRHDHRGAAPLPAAIEPGRSPSAWA